MSTVKQSWLLMIALSVGCLVGPERGNSLDVKNRLASVCSSLLRREPFDLNGPKAQRRADILKIIINPTLKFPVHSRFHQQTVLSLYGAKNLNELDLKLNEFSIGSRAPAKRIIRLINWLERQPNDFAQDFYDRLLLTLREDPRDESRFKSFIKLMAQDPNSTQPRFSVSREIVFRDIDLVALRSQNLVQKLVDDELALSLSNETRRLEQNDFYVNRGESEVRNILGFDVASLMGSSGIFGHWYDIGSGLALLQREILHRLGPLKNGKMFAVVLKRPTPQDFEDPKRDTEKGFDARVAANQLDEDLVKFDKALIYLEGQPVEERDDLPSESGMMVSDIVGAIHYTRDLRRVLEVEAGVLKPRGLLVSHRSAAQIITARGEVLDWYEYAVRYGTGLKSKISPPRRRGWISSMLNPSPQAYGVALERTTAPLSLPGLDLIAVPESENPPPIRIYFCATCF